MTLTRPFTAIGFTVILALTSSEVAAQTHGQVMSADFGDLGCVEVAFTQQVA